ncbi:MAG: molecular chaperone DnaK, partial [Patescibacteria group bacterium]
IKDNLQTSSAEVLKQKTQELSSSMQKIGQYMYKQGEQNNSNEQNKQDEKGQEGKDKKDDPVEGEVVE